MESARPMNDNNNDMAIILNGLTMYKINLNSINGRTEILCVCVCVRAIVCTLKRKLHIQKDLILRRQFVFFVSVYEANLFLIDICWWALVLQGWKAESIFMPSSFWAKCSFDMKRWKSKETIVCSNYKGKVKALNIYGMESMWKSMIVIIDVATRILPLNHIIKIPIFNGKDDEWEFLSYCWNLWPINHIIVELLAKGMHESRDSMQWIVFHLMQHNQQITVVIRTTLMANSHLFSW